MCLDKIHEENTRKTRVTKSYHTLVTEIISSYWQKKTTRFMATLLGSDSKTQS